MFRGEPNGERRLELETACGMRGDTRRRRPPERSEGNRNREPTRLDRIGFALLFASSYFSVITPQGGSQNIIFAASGYLTQPELYELGALVTLAYLLVYLLIGSPWVYFVMG